MFNSLLAQFQHRVLVAIGSIENLTSESTGTLLQCAIRGNLKAGRATVEGYILRHVAKTLIFDKSRITQYQLMKMAESNQYDFMIVGGGLAGCTFASRLKQGDQSLSILIIEAGAGPKNHLLVTSALLACFGAHGSDLDWHYKTRPQSHLNNEIRFVPAGKALSGGTATNYGTWTRGGATDYDHWAKLVGDPRWSYQGMLPYFKKTEHHFAPGADPEQHGLMDQFIPPPLPQETQLANTR
jgi:hypothetical protein